MPMERITVEDYAAFGTLVKQWTRGELAVPTTRAELEEQAVNAGVGLTMPDRITKVEVVRRKPDTMTLVLPIAEMVQDTEDKIAEGAAYGLPSFYFDLDGMEEPLEMDEATALAFHCARIGDYTTGQCA